MVLRGLLCLRLRVICLTDAFIVATSVLRTRRLRVTPSPSPLSLPSPAPAPAPPPSSRVSNSTTSARRAAPSTATKELPYCNLPTRMRTAEHLLFSQYFRAAMAGTYATLLCRCAC
eukprot:4499312-Pleurochrysis_carterae.AAC.4